MSESVKRVARILRREYALSVVRCIETTNNSYNSHFLGEADNGNFHVKLHRPTGTSVYAVRLSEIIYCQSVVRRLADRGCRLVRRPIKCRSGRTLFTDGSRIYEVFRYVNITGKVANLHFQMASALGALHDAMSSLRSIARPGPPRLRFLPFAEACRQIRTLLEARYAKRSKEKTFQRLVHSADCLQRWHSERAKNGSVAQLIHGDYDQSNVLVKKTGGVCIIDFDCCYVDIREWDVAHGMLSVGLDRYFSGKLDEEKFYGFLTAYNAHVHIEPVSRLDACLFCAALLLKKICYVTRQRNLHSLNRISLIEQLIRLGGLSDD